MAKKSFHLKIWRQPDALSPGKFEDYDVSDLSDEMSILELLDSLNNTLVKEGKDAIAFDSDCREGICGTCGLVIQGVAHGTKLETTTCELRMRHFKDGQTISIEPFRAKSFPVVKDLVVDRSAFDRIVEKGGYVSVNPGSAQEANMTPIAKDKVEACLDASICIGCGACVAACPNASAALFTAAKISQYTFLPQGKPERERRVLQMVEQMDREGFGNCSNHGECQAVCPKNISIANIARMRREYILAAFKTA